MSNRKREKKSIRKIQVPKDYSGEASPYWDFLGFKANQTVEGGIQENVLANPDLLGEDEHIFHRPLTEEGEFQFRLIRDMMGELSPQQQRVLQLCGFDGLSLIDTAKELKISVSSVTTLLERAKEKIRRKFNQEWAKAQHGRK